MEEIVVFKDVNKSFGKKKRKQQALHNLNLTIHKGEVFGFLGPNGAGKSTTIKLLLGFLQADRGVMELGGIKVGLSEYRHLVGYLSELPFFYDHLTALETLMVSGRLSGMKRDEIIERGVMLLTQMNLDNVVNVKVSGFSKGMKQRLGLVNALINDPPVLILDEPMSGLDPLGRYLVKSLIHELKEEGKTIFFSSHILSDIEELCDRIGVIHKGVLLYTGDLNGFIRSGHNLEEQFIKVINDDEYAIFS